MSEKVSWSLLTLPIDIIYRILYQIDNFTIFCSIRGVCARVNAILVTYYRYQNLTTLVLKHYRIGNEDVQRLSTALKNDTTLTILSLNDNGVEALGTQYLADALPNNKMFTNAKFPSNRICNELAWNSAYRSRNTDAMYMLHCKKRNVNAKLRKLGYKTSNTSVCRAKTELKLKWWKRQTVQKLTNQQKIQRIFIAKQLRKKYGTKKGGKIFKWNCVLNTDFSGAFKLSPQNNRHNEGVYAESSLDIPYELRTISKQKFQKSIMLWGGISYKGLFPEQSPIFVDEWLELTRPKDTDRRKKVYYTGDRYAKFIQTIVADKAAKELGDLRNLVFQDDQDRKQRMHVALNAVKRVFINRIESKDCNAKLADVWPIENVWGALKENLRGREYDNIEQLKDDIKKEWIKFSVSLCQQMMDKIPARLKLVIDQGGNQIREH
ncbi:unnamed protein product [Rotaria magnacalcarata]|uniref:F-box domain-containing protein n=2 Tax=Rotaria magnacalcarata TaxID=392030 RepID=A0A820ART4_9BILA|nr:unnamed protein product [Rotaria magnacalcarata]